MSFRRIPFQFSSTDPLERQAELQKRFGLSSNRENMYVDMVNPVSVGIANKGSNNSSSPRLQHRIPIFMQGEEHPVKSSVDAVGSNSDNRKSNVRVIPIEIEDADCQQSTRHRTFSGPAGWAKEKRQYESVRDDSSPLKCSMQDIPQPTKVKVATGPKVHNIPIQIDGRNSSFKSPKLEKEIKTSIPKKDSQINGCAPSKSSNKVKSPEKQQNVEQEQNVDSGIGDLLKKITSVLEELKSYESGVREFIGTVKDKQYRYLDEMLTRCMLRLDDIDTMGNKEVRSSRKSAVKKVQASIDLLETKVNTINEDASKTINSEMKDKSKLPKDVDIKENSNVCNENSKSASQDKIFEADMVEITDSQCEVPKENIQDISENENALKKVNVVVMAENKTPVNDTNIVDSEIEKTEDRDHITIEDDGSSADIVVPEVEMLKDMPDKFLVEKIEKEVSENHDPVCSLTKKKLSDVEIDIQDLPVNKENEVPGIRKPVIPSSFDNKGNAKPEVLIGDTEVSKETVNVSDLPVENKCLEVSTENHNSTEL